MAEREPIDSDAPANLAVFGRRNSDVARLGIDPQAVRHMKLFEEKPIRELTKFSPEMLEEVKNLFDRFDRSRDRELDRQEFATMMRTLGLDLSETELNKFFDRMDESGDGIIEFKELVEFLEHIAQPLTVEEELAEAFFFFQPSDGTAERRPEEELEGTEDSGSEGSEGLDPDGEGDSDSDSDFSDSSERDNLERRPAISAKGLCQALQGMGEDITEDECAEMISAATGGQKTITFEQFKEWSAPVDDPRDSPSKGRVARLPA